MSAAASTAGRAEHRLGPVRDADHALELVESAASCTALFGPAEPVGDPDLLRAAKRRFRRVTYFVHPDRNGSSERARTAAARAQELYDEWTKLATGETIAPGGPGPGSAGGSSGSGSRTDPVVLRGSSGRDWLVGELYARGSACSVLRASAGDGTRAVAKVPRSPRVNSMTIAEREALADLARVAETEKWAADYVPQLLDSVRCATQTPTGGRGSEYRVNVLAPLTHELGWLTLAEVLERVPGGMDPRDYAWVHRRVLRALDAAQRAGWVHCAVSPANTMVHPERHGVVLAGWTFAAREGSPAPVARAASLRRAMPGELAKGKTVGHATDVYMAAQMMLDALEPGSPGVLRTHARGCMQKSSESRPSAREAGKDFDDVIERLWGSRRFRPFAVPGFPPNASE